MLAVRIQICRYVDDAQPGWVECILTDAFGEKHVFVEKVPVVTAAQLDTSSKFPQLGLIACTVHETDEAISDLVYVRIDTEAPWGVASSTGQSEFVVSEEQLVELNVER